MLTSSLLTWSDPLDQSQFHRVGYHKNSFYTDHPSIKICKRKFSYLHMLRIFTQRISFIRYWLVNYSIDDDFRRFSFEKLLPRKLRCYARKYNRCPFSRMYTAYSLSHCPIWITRVTKQQYHSHLTWWSISRAYITRPAHGIRLYNLTRSVFFERCLKASLRHVHGLNHTHTESNVEHSHTWKQVTSCIVNQTFIHTNASHDWRSYNQQQQCCECRHDIWKIKLNHFFL